VNGADEFVKEQDVVVVYLHHRLNVFGYLYLGAFDEKYRSSGMAGMIDLILGLQWVRDNVAKFGGDPEKVTILGESGGGMKCCTLLNMPAAKDLFRSAIVESGSGKVGQDGRAQATEAARTVLKNLGIGENELDKLADVPAEDIMKAAEPVWRMFRPIPDDVYLMTQDIPAFGYEENGRRKPILVGSSEDEMASFPGPGDTEPITDENLAARLYASLNRSMRPGAPVERFSAEKIADIIDTFKRVAVQDDPEQLYWNINSLGGMLGCGAYYQALERSVIGGAKVFGYFNAFDVPDTVNTEKRYAWHVSDLALQYRIVAYDFCEKTSRILANAWGAFIRNQDPSTEELPWPEFTPVTQKILRVDQECEIVTDYRKELLASFE